MKEARDFITQLIRENTQRLDQLNMLLCERKDLEVALDSRQKNLVSEHPFLSLVIIFYSFN